MSHNKYLPWEILYESGESNKATVVDARGRIVAHAVGDEIADFIIQATMATNKPHILAWRDATKQVPSYGAFGHSPQVIGLDKNNERNIYVYIRGDWHINLQEVEPPTHWHYLPSRSMIDE